MKMKLVLAGAFAISAISCAFAQAKAGGGQAGPKGPGMQRQGGPGGMRRGGMMNNPELAKQLNLTEAQKAKMKALSDNMRKKMEALKPEERRTKGREMFMSMRKQMDAILTPKQKAILEKWRKDHPPMRGFGGPGGPGGPGGKPGAGGKPGSTAKGGKGGI